MFPIHVAIRIGGPIPAEALSELASAVNQEGLCYLGERVLVDSPAELKRYLNDGHLQFEDERERSGSLVILEPLLQKHRIPYDCLHVRRDVQKVTLASYRRAEDIPAHYLPPAPITNSCHEEVFLVQGKAEDGEIIRAELRKTIESQLPPLQYVDPAVFDEQPQSGEAA